MLANNMGFYVITEHHAAIEETMYSKEGFVKPLEALSIK